MSTFGAVKTAIARRLLDEDNTAVTDVEIGEAINEAIRKWKVKRFWFNTGEEILDIQEGDTQVVLPSDFLMPIPKNFFTIQFSGYTYQVKKYSPSRFDAINSTSITGRPLRCTLRDGVIQFSPAANQEYPGTLYYLQEFNDFLTDGTQDNLTNDFLTNAEMLIRNEALTQIHGELRQDEKMEKRYATRTDSEYNVLRTRTAMSYRTGTLTIEQ